MLGEREVPLPRFSVFKATEAIGLVTEIVTAYPELVEQVADYQDRHGTDVPVLNEQGEPLRDEQGELVMQRVPGDFYEAVAHVAPEAYKLARGKVLDLLALVVTSNEELERADLAGLSIHRNGTGEWATAQGYKAVAHEAELQQLGRLLITARDVLKDQLEAADPQTRQVMEALLARLPRIGMPTLDEPEPGSSDSSPSSSRGAARSSSTGSRGKKRSTSAAS